MSFKSVDSHNLQAKHLFSEALVSLLACFLQKGSDDSTIQCSGNIFLFFFAIVS